jgi:hypothetical protein
MCGTAASRLPFTGVSEVVQVSLLTDARRLSRKKIRARSEIIRFQRHERRGHFGVGGRRIQLENTVGIRGETSPIQPGAV